MSETASIILKSYEADTSNWNEEKERGLFKNTGLRSFEEMYSNERAFYDPKYFEVREDCGTFLHYIGTLEEGIPQPVNVKNMSRLFEQRYDLKSLDLSNWDVSEVECMQSMFAGCSGLEKIVLDT